MKRSELLIPLVLTALLAGALGFVSGHSMWSEDGTSRVVVAPIRATVQPTPSPSPTPADSPSPDPADRRREGRDPRCPRNCTCDFSGNNQVVICQN